MIPQKNDIEFTKLTFTCVGDSNFGNAQERAAPIKPVLWGKKTQKTAMYNEMIHISTGKM